MFDPGLIDVQALLLEVDPERPCGENLEYDPAFLELEEAVHGKGEVQYGDTIMAAVPPDWKVIHSLSNALIARSRDLRIAVLLTRTNLHFHGLPGLAAGLSLIENLIDQRWESVHPQLDPLEEFDPTARVNILSSIEDQSGLSREVWNAPLVDSRLHGRFSLRQVEMATSDMVGEKSSGICLHSIETAFLEVEIESLFQTLNALSSAYESAVRIEGALTERAGAGKAISLTQFLKMLKRARNFVHERAMARSERADAVARRDDEKDSVRLGDADEGRGYKSNEINNRADVVRVIEKICIFYAVSEPSSPIPLLLQRAKRLVDKNFMDILADFAPNGINQALLISGMENQSEQVSQHVNNSMEE